MTDMAGSFFFFSFLFFVNSNLIPATENELVHADLSLLTLLINEIFFTSPRVFLQLKLVAFCGFSFFKEIH